MDSLERLHIDQFLSKNDPLDKVAFKLDADRDFLRSYGYLKWDYHEDGIRDLLLLDKSEDVFSIQTFKKVQDSDLPDQIKSIYRMWRLGIWRSFREIALKCIDGDPIDTNLELRETHEKISLIFNYGNKAIFLTKDGSFGYEFRNTITEEFDLYVFSKLNDFYTILTNVFDYVIKDKTAEWISDPQVNGIFDFRYQSH